jgi:DnaJ-class molecular chaperone
MALETCKKCQGQKKVPDMGGIRVKCKMCAGSGKTEIVQPSATATPSVTVKRSRRKEIQLDIANQVKEYE